jgi:RNA polymerase sigma-70 factor (ECF subfamily)
VAKSNLYDGYSDADLMKRICKAEVPAFNEIYKRYSKRLLYYFYRMLGNSEEMAQDFLQDLFYKLIDKPYLYNPDQRFSTWIFSIAHNMCKNEYRRRAVRNNLFSSGELNTYHSHDEDTAELTAVVNLIYDELDILGESHKTAFILRYKEGLQVKEIGEILDLPEGTVKSRLFYARQILAGKLKKADESIEYYKT